ncbi:hypothetical protein N7509_002298 [Penicillium cosmopolitanum]|uniref:Major facilitator superfamily (MFS) profile domain-containing protein n=1 Tax=Penicillium cosmopolitanum TaxID=1131564 RepID=A0A9W9W953_9EURO|nr:uncharacterized protein N7509_002298 [Penicillium cosmopolitanum]KAJ5408415.1 hypothetical protein N7509_002298 [Penicillium cosmopolitanum]
MEGDEKPWGYKIRSSRLLVNSTITVALFTETFLASFLTPIIGYMLEERLHIDPSQTQSYTTLLLSSYGFVGLISAPAIAYFAERMVSQRTPLLIALAGCLVGTFMVALTSSFWVLFLGRVLQSLCGSATWVVGFALLASNVDRKNLGSSMGTAMSFVTAGTVAGPTLSGSLLQLFGYWAAWAIPIVLLTLDIIGRLVMIEPKIQSPNISTPSSDLGSKSSDATPNNDEEALDESTTLLSSPSPTLEQGGSTYAYFRTFFSDSRVLVGLANILIVASLLSGINNTLPVHLREAFGWNSLLVSAMFFCIQIPNILLGGLAGWLRDRLGLRRPTTLGWLTIVPLILLLGAPGDPRFPWAKGDAAGKPLFTGCAIALGSVLPLVRGVGAVQLAFVVKDWQAKDPHLFNLNKSNLRVFSVTETIFSLGGMLGPLLTGSLFEKLGFFLHDRSTGCRLPHSSGGFMDLAGQQTLGSGK